VYGSGSSRRCGGETVDRNGGELRVRRSQAELKHGRTIIKDPKSEAGKRSVAIPAVVLAELRDHLGRFSEAGPDGLVFVGPGWPATATQLPPAVDQGTHGRRSERRGRSLPAPHR
ncbi:MAG: hypothetical protein ACRDUW_27805, partial [Pseudonocardiaceae bacterium]